MTLPPSIPARKDDETWSEYLNRRATIVQWRRMNDGVCGILRKPVVNWVEAELFRLMDSLLARQKVIENWRLEVTPRPAPPLTLTSLAPLPSSAFITVNMMLIDIQKKFYLSYLQKSTL